ncbi:MAG: hypothetical protein M1830_007721 [Pleopsidium flavum]|nr:MAG: hypothetical protein M1830_007721 [Pleopsidium flavum]
MPLHQSSSIRRSIERPLGALALLEEALATVVDPRNAPRALALLEEALNTAVEPLLKRQRRDLNELVDKDDDLRFWEKSATTLMTQITDLGVAARGAVRDIRGELDDVYTEKDEVQVENGELEVEKMELLADLRNCWGEIGALKADKERWEVWRENLEADNERLEFDNQLLRQQLANQPRGRGQRRQRPPARAVAPAAGSGAGARARAPARARARTGASAGVVQHQIARQPSPVRAPTITNRPKRACTVGVNYKNMAK